MLVVDQNIISEEQRLPRIKSASAVTGAAKLTECHDKYQHGKRAKSNSATEQVQLSSSSFIALPARKAARLPASERTLRNVPSIGRPGAYKRVILFGGIVRVTENATDLPVEGFEEALEELKEIAGGRCQSKDPCYAPQAMDACYRVARSVLSNDGALQKARACGLISLLAHVIEDAFEGTRSKVSRDHAARLIKVVDGIWFFIWELLKKDTTLMEDVCRTQLLEWAVCLIRNQAKHTQVWAAYIVNRLSYYMHVSRCCFAKFASLYDAFLQTNPAVWQTSEEQMFFMRLTAAMLQDYGETPMCNYTQALLEFCLRLAERERHGCTSCKYLLEYLLVAVVFTRLVKSENVRRVLQQAAMRKLLQQIADTTSNKAVERIAAALSAYELFEAESVFDGAWMAPGAGPAANSVLLLQVEKS